MAPCASHSSTTSTRARRRERQRTGEWQRDAPRAAASVTVHPIRTEADYAAALSAIDVLMDAELGTPEGGRLDVLTLVKAQRRRCQRAGSRR